MHHKLSAKLFSVFFATSASAIRQTDVIDMRIGIRIIRVF